jgi:hypothetical protein
MLVKMTPEMFQNNNFVNKDGQKISFGGLYGEQIFISPLCKGNKCILSTPEVTVL